MRYFVGLDASLDTTNLCIIDADGKTLREGKISSDPKALAAFLDNQNCQYNRIGIESSTTGMWLYRELVKAGYPVICIEARHAHGVLKARINKTDRNDARGIAEIMHAGIYKPVHGKTEASQHRLALLTARKLLQIKVVDIENGIDGILRGFGLRVRRVRADRYEEQISDLIRTAPLLEPMIKALLTARAAIRQEFDRLDHRVKSEAENDPICRRLMTAPGVGPLVALTYRAVIDVPTRFRRSRTVGAHVGLTPKQYSSGLVEWRGRISRYGDSALRAALFKAAVAVLHPRTHSTVLQSWGREIAKRRGKMKAIVAVARRLSVILHRMWSDGADFQDHVKIA